MTSSTSQMNCRAPKLMIHMCHQYGRTALHWAGGVSHTKIVKLLLDRGVNVDTATSDHSTLFHITPVHLLPLPYCPCLSLCLPLSPCLILTLLTSPCLSLSHVQKLVSVFCTSCLPLSFISSQSVLPLSEVQKTLTSFCTCIFNR